MNNKEYWSQANALSTPNYKMIHAKLEKWKLENNITERCVVHHRDDTEETQKYNEEHYERWGLNDNGEFIEGQYVIFMTRAEHAAYHNKQRSGENNPFYGRKHSAETRAKMTVAHKGKKRSEETREKISAACKSAGTLYNTYKNNGGTLKWNDFHKALKNGEIILENAL